MCSPTLPACAGASLDAAVHVLEAQHNLPRSSDPGEMEHFEGGRAKNDDEAVCTLGETETKELKNGSFWLVVERRRGVRSRGPRRGTDVQMQESVVLKTMEWQKRCFRTDERFCVTTE